MNDSKVKVGGFYDAKMRRLAEGSFGDFFSPKETLESGRVSDKSDVWAVGCILYALTHPSSVAEMTKLKGCTFVSRSAQGKLPVESKLSEEVKDFLNKTIVLNENNRLSWLEMLAHPIFKGFFKKSITKLSSMKDTRLLDFPKLGKIIE
jgi:serine/threonine protein kinase